MIFILVELFGIDLTLAENFVKQLGPADLMALGQEVIKGGFPFSACTRLIKMKVEEVTFEVPLTFLLDEGVVSDDKMSFNFA